MDFATLPGPRDRRTEQVRLLSEKRSCARLSQLVGKDKEGRLHPTVPGPGHRI